jgi:hypothetical protein
VENERRYWDRALQICYAVMADIYYVYSFTRYS